jgi:hypothetical protein
MSGSRRRSWWRRAVPEGCRRGRAGVEQRMEREVQGPWWLRIMWSWHRWRRQPVAELGFSYWVFEVKKILQYTVNIYIYRFAIRTKLQLVHNSDNFSNNSITLEQSKFII